jgi:TonB-dependent receptor
MTSVATRAPYRCLEQPARRKTLLVTASLATLCAFAVPSLASTSTATDRVDLPLDPSHDAGPAITTKVAVAKPLVLASAAGDGATASAPAQLKVAAAAKPKGSAIETVVVQAQRTPASVARKAQQEAPNLINIQTYQEIRKLPDVTVAEAVRRVPGISLETDEGEGRYVNIRGFDADLNSTTFGGLRLPPTNNASPFGGYRAVTMDSIPIGLVGAITVTKSNLPNMDAEDLGGTIEITPKTAPPGGDVFIQGNIGTGFEPLRGRGIYDVAVTAGGRFGFDGIDPDGPFSIVVTGSYYDDYRGINDVEPAYINNNTATPGTQTPGDPLYFALNNIQQRDYQLHRRRHTVGIDLGYQPDDRNSYYVRAFDAGYSEYYDRQYLNLTPDGSPTVNPDKTITDTLNGASAIQKALRDERETSIDRIIVAGGKNIFDGAILDYRVGYTIGNYIKPYDYNSFFNFTNPMGNPTTITYSPTGHGGTPLYTINPGAGVNYLDPNNYALSSIQNSTADNFDKEYSGAANLLLDVNWLGGDTEALEFGASARLRHKQQVAQPLNGFNLTPLSLAAASNPGNEIYYDRQYQNGVDIIPHFLQKTFGLGTLFVDPACTDPDPRNCNGDVRSALAQFIGARENVLAGYFQYQVTWGELGVVGGLRVENTVDHTHAFALGVAGPPTSPSDPPAGTPLPPVPVTGRRNYVDFFPSVQARYEIEPDLIARATFSSTLARPGFNQFTPASTFDNGSHTVTKGNPNLRAATANSFDASLEYYLEDAGILSIGVFDKEISNYIIPNTLLGQPPPPETGNHDPVTLITFTNAGPSYARGVEFNWMQHFTDLPELLDVPEWGWLGGLGAGFNLTYVDSNYEIRPGEHSALPSTSPMTWNATLFYERGPLTLRLAAYSVSHDLFGIGGDRTSDVFNSSRTSMDFGSSYALDDNDNLAIYFNAKNLLNTPHAFFEGRGTDRRVIQREYYDETYQFGVRFDY